MLALLTLGALGDAKMRLLNLPARGLWPPPSELALLFKELRCANSLSHSPLDAFLDSERGPRQHVLAEDEAGRVLGGAHLGRLALGGYVVLRADFHLSTVLVRPACAGDGVGQALVNELLWRLPSRSFRAWAMASPDEYIDGIQASTFFERCGGENCGGLRALLPAHPLVTLALVLSAGARTRSTSTPPTAACSATSCPKGATSARPPRHARRVLRLALCSCSAGLPASRTTPTPR